MPRTSNSAKEQNIYTRRVRSLTACSSCCTREWLSVDRNYSNNHHLSSRYDASSSEAVSRPSRRNICIPGDADAAAAAASETAEPVRCPNGKHQLKKKGDTCPCVLLALFETKVREPVISEWHSRGSEELKLGGFHLSRTRVFQGGQGVVYTVQVAGNTNNRGEELVMKIKDRRPNQKTRSWRRDLREVFLLKELRHPFIVEMKHAFLTDTFYSLVMEHGSRGSLWSLVCKRGCMPRNLAAYYVSCMLSAIHHVHKHNFIFRDMKAENVVIMDDYRPKLIDFGMAKAFNKPNVRNTFTNFYFAAYIAPEVYAEPKSVTEKVDSWGIGYLTLELTVGLGVFKALPWATSRHTQADWRFQMPRKLVTRVSRDTLRFIEKCLERQPERRPSLEKMKEFQFLRGTDFRLLLASKPPDLAEYLENDKGDRK